MSDTVEKKSLLEFPCRFPLKVMGDHHEEFAATILDVVKEHAKDADHKDMAVKPSSTGKYLALTLTVNATSQEQLDNIYRALTSHPMVKVVL